MISSANPITMLEDLIWFVLESCPEWAAIVRPGNRIKLTEDQSRVPARQDADLPAAYLFHAPFQFNRVRGGQTASIEAAFSLMLQTGSKMTGSTTSATIAQETVNEVLWQTFRAFERYATPAVHPLGPMLQPGTLGLTDASSDLRQAERPGYVYVVTVGGRLIFNRSEMCA